MRLLRHGGVEGCKHGPVVDRHIEDATVVQLQPGADPKFGEPQRLTPITGGLFMANAPGLLPETVREPAVRQGFLEGANTSPVAEMANLITAMRGFEANQKIVQLNDERMGRAISELGNPN